MAFNIYIKQKLKEAQDEEATNPWENLSIYRVPNSLRERDDKAFVPQMVSIGPFHHGKRELTEMEPHKWRALNHVLQRTRHDIDWYINAIQPLEEQIRSSYEGCISMDSDEFLLSLVLDGIFVLEVLVGAVTSDGFVKLGYSSNDPVFAMRGVVLTVQREMIMLENQIPFFVLDKLLAKMEGTDNQPLKVAKMAVCFFDPLIPMDEPLNERDSDLMEENTEHLVVGLHCLDAFRRSLLRANQQCLGQSSATPSVNYRGRHQLIHCVSELQVAGIRCRKKKTDGFMDISFDRYGTLQIPKISIDDGTESVFHNLIAFEQCHLGASNNIITSYMIFMHNLINTQEDVRYLRNKKIIEHWLGSDKEVADMFSRLCHKVVFDFNDSYFSDLSDRINRYYDKRWNTWRAILKHRYFSNPWSTISFLAAVFLLLLTSTKTFYTGYAYHFPRAAPAPTPTPPASPPK